MQSEPSSAPAGSASICVDDPGSAAHPVLYAIGRFRASQKNVIHDGPNQEIRFVWNDRDYGFISRGAGVDDGDIGGGWTTF